MARWDDFEVNWIESEEESKLLEKFNQYVDLQRNQTDRQKSTERKIPKLLKNQNAIIAVVEGTILSGLAMAFAIMISF